MSIPGLGNLGGLGKLLDPGAIVKDVVGGILPKEMGAAGGIAGAVVDFKLGNPIGGIQHAMEALKDLPQMFGGRQQPVAGGLLHRLPPELRERMEPSPPPRQGKPVDLKELLSAIKDLIAALSANKGAGTNGTPAAPSNGQAPNAGPAPNGSPSNGAAPSTTTTTTSTTTSGAPASAPPQPAAAPAAAPQPAPTPDTPQAPSAHGRTSTTTTTTTTTTTSGGRSGQASWQGQPATPPPATWQGQPATPPPATWQGQPATPPPATTPTSAPTPASTTAPADAPASTAPAATSAPAPASTAAPAAPATTPAASTTGQTISSIDQLRSMSDQAVRDAVINGRISPEIAKDQTAMMAIQQRMNAISEMNNLLTNMMKALHDMQMAVIQNIRI